MLPLKQKSYKAGHIATMQVLSIILSEIFTNEELANNKNLRWNVTTKSNFDI